VVGTAVTGSVLLTIYDRAPAAMVLGMYLITGTALGMVPACAVGISEGWFLQRLLENWHA